jgi:hypothetical protein
VPSRLNLGRVTGGLDVSRGPDVTHRVRVPSSWLDEGAIVEIELPRNLACAKCDGGGCDACERAGAITLRGREEPPEIVRVTLPKRGDSAELTASGRGVVLRIPERGGLSDRDGSVRGLLMLTVIAGDRLDPGVVRLEAPQLLDVAPPGKVAVRAKSVRPAAARPNRVVSVVAVLVALWIIGLIVLRTSGCA